MKVNCLSGLGSTHPDLVYLIAEHYRKLEYDRKILSSGSGKILILNIENSKFVTGGKEFDVSEMMCKDMKTISKHLAYPPV